MSPIQSNTNLLEPVVTSEKIEAAMQKGRRERSLAFWRMIQDIFGRSEDREAEGDALPRPGSSRMAVGSH
jgi:hypothetical protein